MDTYIVSTRSGTMRRIVANSHSEAASIIAAEQRETVREVRAARPVISSANTGRRAFTDSEVEAGVRYCIINR